MADDWDEGGGVATSGFGSSSGGGFGGMSNGLAQNGFSNGDSDGGRRKGFGRGAPKSDSTSPSSGRSGGFSSSGGGFGSGGGGFGGDDDRGSGFGSKKPIGGGFGGKSGFGGGGFSGGGDADDGGGRGGGFGGGGGACHKCGESGHFARECPQGGGRGGDGCRKCGESGHFARECPQGGGGSRACYKCNEEGHMARDCPTGGGGGGGSRACYKCNEEGHMARDCPTAGGGGGGGSRACYKCNEEGHMARDCPTAGGSGGGFGGGSSGGFGGGGSSGGFGGGGSSGGFGGGGSSGGDTKCYKCNETGHFARECPNAESSGGGFGGGGGGDNKCFKCQETGHFARECPNAEAAGEGGDDDRPKPVTYVPPTPSETEEEMFKSIQQGINFEKYDAIDVEVSGNNPVAHIKTFEEANLYETFSENVRRAQYKKPTPVQKYSLPIILAGRDLMACAQTGSGKTAAFLLPVMTGIMNSGLTSSSFSETQTPQAICIAPTRELANQIYLEARKFAYSTMLRPVVCYGGVSVSHQARQLQSGCNFLVGTPGRLTQFIEDGKVSLSGVKYLILDEADRMLDMGFESAIRKIVEGMGMPDKTDRQTLMFSATFPEEIQRLAGDFLNDYLFLTVGRVGGTTSDIEQTVVEVSEFEKRDKLTEILGNAGTDRTLVFVESKRGADFLAIFLSQEGFPTTSIHGDRMQQEREEALNDFKKGRCPVLIATNVAARGLDIDDVKHVINFDLPSDIDEYVHRIGRTGRIGNKGKATTFFMRGKDEKIARGLVKVLSDAKQEVPDWLDEIAEGAVGTDYGPSGGRFGSRDTRKQRGGGRGGGGGDDDFSSGFDTTGANSWGPTASAGGDDDWD